MHQIADSIKTIGFSGPGRVEAAKLLGKTEIPFVRLEHMTPDQKEA